MRHFCDTQIASKIAGFGPFSRNVCCVGVFFLTWETHIGSIEQRIHEEEVFDRICVRYVQKRRIFKRGPGDSGGRPINVTNNNSSWRAKSQPSILWSKLSPVDLSHFSNCMEIALDLIVIPPTILHGCHLCTDDHHKYDIESYFSRIVDSMLSADSTLKRGSFKSMKPYWSSELSSLKQKSYISHKVWVENGKPEVGCVFEDYRESRANYRRKLRQEQRTTLKDANDKLYMNLVDKDNTAFWQTWKKLSQSHDPLPAQIDGFACNYHIADVFSNIYKQNDASSHENLRREFYTTFPSFCSFLFLVARHGRYVN